MAGCQHNLKLSSVGMFLTVSDESVNHFISTPESAVNVVSM